MTYAGSIPTIAQAYQNDPRTKLAASMLGTGMSTAPVAQGGWAVTDGLARAAQAIAGGFMQRNNDKRYGAREDQYMTALKEAAALASQQQQPQAPQMGQPPAMPPPPPMQAAAQALAPTQGVPRPMQAFDPGPSMVPQAPPLASLAPPQAPPSPMGGGTGPNRGATQQLSARDLYHAGIVPIEGGTDAGGKFRTSPKGAIGPGQIMPKTAPEAAKLAGLPYDEQRLRTDPAYNNALGEAYYAKQLQDFGDPALAAAAYNAGPGRVRRAVRVARLKGTSWEQHIPAETQAYVTKFRETVGTSSGSSGGSTVTAARAPPVQAPTMEQVPQAPEAPPAQRPNAPGLPDEVQSNRVSMAQKLLASGNPDLAAIAQDYLDKGLDEQNTARLKRSDQQYGRDNMGYTSELNDWQNSRQDGRQFGYDQVKNAESRNFTRESTNTSQTFTHGENQAEREQQANLANQNHFWQSQEAQLQRTFDADQGDKNRATSTENATSKSVRNPLLDTPTGLKLQSTLDSERDTNQSVMASLGRFLDLNKKQATGGWILGTGAGKAVAGMTDAEVKEMDGLANEIVIGKLGGLGVAISDGDRQFVSSSMVNTGSPERANHNRGNIVMGVLKRRNDYIYQWQLAQAEGRVTDFMRSWKMYIDSTPVVNSTRKGDINTNPTTYDQWNKGIPKFDANGKRVN